MTDILHQLLVCSCSSNEIHLKLILLPQYAPTRGVGRKQPLAPDVDPRDCASLAGTKISHHVRSRIQFQQTVSPAHQTIT